MVLDHREGRDVVGQPKTRGIVFLIDIVMGIITIRVVINPRGF